MAAAQFNGTWRSSKTERTAGVNSHCSFVLSEFDTSYGLYKDTPEQKAPQFENSRELVVEKRAKR